MQDINQLMTFLRQHHRIHIEDKQIQDLRNIGYFHGFKGYRFFRSPKNQISFSNFNEVIDINKFDLQLKSLFYPLLMIIENALKSYVLEAVLIDSQSESLNDVFSKSITEYKNYPIGSEKYKQKYITVMNLKEKINNTLVRDYRHDRQTVSHFFNQGREIPIWAVFESLPLGDFGTLFSCSNTNVKLYVSKLINFPNNLDADGKLTQFIIFALRDLRNAVAHNGTVFDTRFRTASISTRLINLLKTETQIYNFDIKYIDTYFILIVYLLSKFGIPNSYCISKIDDFINCYEDLRKKLPIRICTQIMGSQFRSNMNSLKEYIQSYE